VREEAVTFRAEFAAVREAAEAAKADARRGDERVEAMQAELAYALASLDELKQGLSSAGQAAVIARREAEQARKAAQTAGDGSTSVTEVFQQILGMAASRGGSGVGRPRREAPALAPKKPEPVKREPRHGFDDVASPLAILGLDGKFKELNPAFAKLVGYQEHEFAKAAWPSPHDRRDYKDQLEQLSKLKSGELREIEVQSTYMHGQGLMVPVIGKLSAVAGEDGLPNHLVLTAEDRHHG
jgi:PAS domain S-box-containing protein